MARMLVLAGASLAVLVLAMTRWCAPSPVPQPPAPAPAPAARAPEGLRPVDADACRFGKTLVGTTKSCNPVWLNHGPAGVTVAGHQLDDGGGVFAAAPPAGFTAAVAVGARTPAVPIRYTPDAADDDTGKFTPLLDPADLVAGRRSKSIDLEGTGVFLFQDGEIEIVGESASQALDFGRWPVGTVKTHPLELKNNGSVDRTLNVVWSHGDRGFALDPVVAQVRIPAGQAVTVTLRFSSPLGVQTDGVIFLDATTSGHFAGIALRGEGFAPDEDESSDDPGGSEND